MDFLNKNAPLNFSLRINDDDANSADGRYQVLKSAVDVFSKKYARIIFAELMKDLKKSEYDFSGLSDFLERGIIASDANAYADDSSSSGSASSKFLLPDTKIDQSINDMFDADMNEVIKKLNSKGRNHHNWHMNSIDNEDSLDMNYVREQIKQSEDIRESRYSNMKIN